MNLALCINYVISLHVLMEAPVDNMWNINIDNPLQLQSLVYMQYFCITWWPFSYPLGCLSLCEDDESLFRIVLSVSVIFLILVIAIVIVTIVCLVCRKKKEKPCQVQLDHEQHIYDMPLDTSNSASRSDGMKHVKLNAAYCISGTRSDVKYLKSNVAYGVSMHWA